MSRDVELLYEIGQLRLIRRTWRRFFHSETANIAEHTLRVLWIALMLAKKEKTSNEEKVLKMALVQIFQKAEREMLTIYLGNMWK